MKELLLYIAQSLVEHPDEVTVTERDEDDRIVFELRVAPSDMGKVIGRHGKIAKEIRTLMRSVAQRQGKRVGVDIVDGEETEHAEEPDAGAEADVPDQDE